MILDARGDIAIVQIVFFAPILVTSLIITSRHGFTRRAGWIFLLILAIMRIIGGSIHLASEGNPSNINLRVTYAVLEGAGLSPLLVATIGFLHTIAEHALDNLFFMEKILRLLTVIAIVAIVLVIVGGSQIASAGTNISKLNSAATLRHVGSILLLVVFVLLVLLHLYFWANRRSILAHRRKMLIGISCALPFLGVRVIYSVLSSFAPVVPTETARLSQFSLTTGSWGIYLGMSVLMEFGIVLIYTVVGITTPLQQDEAQTWSPDRPPPSTPQYTSLYQNGDSHQYPPNRV